MLNLQESIKISNNIIHVEDHVFLPYANTSLGKTDLIRIPIQNSNSYLNISESSLYIKGKFTNLKPDTINEVSAVTTFPLFLFEEIKIFLNGVVLETVKKSRHFSVDETFINQHTARIKSSIIF